jgi:hypothetical protein
MFGYLIDVVCAVTPFPLLAWNWSSSEEVVHIHCSKMWAINCKHFFYEICNHFMIPLHLILKNQPAPRFTQEAIDVIKEIGDWFIDEEFSYIRIYGCEGAPHLLPRYVPDRLALREIAYQIVGVGIVASLSRSQKKNGHPFQFH